MTDQVAPTDGVYVARHCGGYVEDDYKAGEPLASVLVTPCSDESGTRAKRP